ncbi:hypothetical protein FJR48_11705 [Sulfurimonas lithotrophica]|uniref:Uncharacterized protein n=1 Tax=Sulfurimonas lithotrophica TaxID=2590022 RepID=A0A5P8P3T6_9BACT|nr:hypothetical protein [Sulfurimonas lithotrophica]QFR50354.1 hypothetical protein FJR48_11705 [Sulfurimonas lithotrophica]
MKNFLLLTFSLTLYAAGPFDSPSSKHYDMSAFHTQKNLENKKASENEKIICRKVCDKKIYKEQVISDAINFYKSSKMHHFDSNSNR